ncbi:unnamed protein product [Pocillopora meandrina]|uniref:Uncharacterized protein n=1 Tax=Pocillopora meandrina TaxID=46732 RepID=A0AAU9XWH7_9CNID|nr:unnamed protein product [Pocillopora meandrina]
MRAQNPDFHNVCFPCPNGFQAFMRISEEQNFKSMDAPCDSNRSSASSTSSLGKMDSRSPQDNELADHLALCIEESVVKVGAAAQLRRRNSSLSRKNSGLRPKKYCKDSYNFKRAYKFTKKSILSEICLQNIQTK